MKVCFLNNLQKKFLQSIKDTKLQFIFLDDIHFLMEQHPAFRNLYLNIFIKDESHELTTFGNV